jgi:hypothetical protein
LDTLIFNLVEDETLLHLGIEDETTELNLNAESSGGTYYEHDYEKLKNQPSINGVTLIGDKTFEELGRDNIKNSRLKSIIDDQYNTVFGG